METTASGRDIPSGEGMTFEKVWLMLAESSKKFDREMKEGRERFEAEMKESREKSEREMRELRLQMQETDRRIQATEKLVRRNSKQAGELSRKFGKLAEHLVAPGITRRFNEIGYNFDAVAVRGLTIRSPNGKLKTEADLILTNTDITMVVEVKAEPTLKDVSHHIRRLEIIREHSDGKRRLQGAIAGAIFGSAEKKATLDAGFFVLEQSGDTMRIEAPEGFVPREW